MQVEIVRGVHIGGIDTIINTAMSIYAHIVA